MVSEHVYIAIDLKSFYASAECVERGLDPMTTNLVVADPARTEKTICLAVSPSLKAYGIPGRPRLFEVIQRVKKINEERKRYAPYGKLTGEAYCSEELKRSPQKALAYITAPPRMAYYMEYSAKIYQIYLKYAAPEDIHVYSIDEVFMDVTGYLPVYGLTAYELAGKIVYDVWKTTGITAVAGIGTNLYLCKIAMDIVAKHAVPNCDGVRIAELDERMYRELLWDHRPLTDFWRIGRGYASKLEQQGMYTMGDVARCSIGKQGDYYNEDLLYKLFGVNAELLIDHAWGWEPVTIEQVKAYHPENNCISSGQVLQCPYDYQKTKLVVMEMADMLVLDLVGRHLVTDQIVLTVGYDRESLRNPQDRMQYRGDITTDHYGREVPKHAHGTQNISGYTSSCQKITEAVLKLFEKIVDPSLLTRRITISANHVKNEADAKKEMVYEQMDLFSDGFLLQTQTEKQDLLKREEQENRIQKAVLDIKKRYGKNAILKGMNLLEGGTAVSRNAQIGGHKAYGDAEEDGNAVGTGKENRSKCGDKYGNRCENGQEGRYGNEKRNKNEKRNRKV